MSELFEQLKKKRKISDDFLCPKYDDCIDPFILPDMNKIINRIEEAKKKKNKILIYGDYDVDGITASVVLFDTLKLVGIQDILIMLPNRFSDGYGMSKKVIQKAKKENVDLIISVDCGSANFEIVDELSKAGIDVIITDHHECSEELPNALAVLNPKRKDFSGPECLRDLAGVGVAFEVARALTEKGLIKNGQEKWLLDLVLIGTICDSMNISEENRRLTYFGMKVLKKTRRAGLKELMKVCQAKKIDSELIGFRIGPRLNAAGRMVAAEKALELLLEENEAIAAKMAVELNDLNGERKKQQDKASKEILSGMDNENNPVIVVKGKWHEGILGIVAGRLTEECQKPSIVLAEIRDELKGSGRSFGDFNLAEALNACQDTIISGGGHAAACGVKVLPDKFDDFKKEINKYHRSLKLENQEKYLIKDADLEVSELSDFNSEFMEEVSELEPFGGGNEEPVFLLKNVFVTDVRRMGNNGEHLRLQVRGDDGKELKNVAFFAKEEWFEIENGQRIDVWINLTENEWNGTKNVEGRILKIGLVEDAIF